MIAYLINHYWYVEAWLKEKFAWICPLTIQVKGMKIKWGKILIAIVWRDYNTAFLCQCWFSFILRWGYWYANMTVLARSQGRGSNTRVTIKARGPLVSVVAMLTFKIKACNEMHWTLLVLFLVTEEDINQLDQLGREWAVMMFCILSDLDTLVEETSTLGRDRKVWPTQDMTSLKQDDIITFVESENKRLRDILHGACIG